MNNNQKLFFRKMGEGPSIIILHGLFGMSDNWNSFAKALADKGFTVYTVDLRNHGQSFHDQVFTYDAMVNDLLFLFEEEEINNPFITGHSMGGKAAMQLALKHPQSIQKLIVIDIAPRYYPLHHATILEALKAVDFNKIITRKDVDFVLTRYELDLATRQFLLKNLFWVTPESLSWRFNLPVITKEIEEVGKAVHPGAIFYKPTLFIAGERSSYLTLSDFSEITSLFPASIIKQAPGAGHWVHADNPSWLLEEITMFIRS